MHTKLTIPERLKDLRVSEKRMSLQELSDATGIPSSTLGNYEKDENIDINELLDEFSYKNNLDILLVSKDENNLINKIIYSSCWQLRQQNYLLSFQRLRLFQSKHNQQA